MWVLGAYPGGRGYSGIFAYGYDDSCDLETHPLRNIWAPKTHPLKNTFSCKTHPLRNVFPKIDPLKSIIVTRSMHFCVNFRENWRCRQIFWKIRPLNEHSGLIRPFKEHFLFKTHPFRHILLAQTHPLRNIWSSKTHPCFIIITVYLQIPSTPRGFWFLFFLILPIYV